MTTVFTFMDTGLPRLSPLGWSDEDLLFLDLARLISIAWSQEGTGS